MFANRAHIHLMPTELFVRRPLLWLQIGLEEARDHHLLAEFRLPALPQGAGRPPARGRRSVVRSASIYNGAEPISVELCNEFMRRSPTPGLKHHAMYPVYGLAEASLAVTLSGARTADYRWIRANRHKLGLGSRIEINPADARDAIELVCVGQVVPNMELRIADDDARRCRTGRSGTS